MGINIDDYELNSCQKIDQIVAKDGHASVVLHLAALVGWQGRHASKDDLPDVAEAARLLAKAGEILERLEAKEEAERRTS